MKDFTIFAYEKANKNKLSCLYIHINSSEISGHLLDAELARVLATQVSFNSIVCVGQASHLSHIQELMRKGGLLYSRLEKKTHSLTEAFRFVFFDSKTGNLYSKLLDGRTDDNPEVFTTLRHDCLNYLFKESQAIRSAPTGIHYESPSKHHTNVFLRTSSVLENPGSLSIIKFWLSTLISKLSFTEILVDTSSILSIATSIAYERYISGGLAIPPPSVSSFKSYQGINDLKINNPDNTLILISASLTGGLYKKLLEAKAKPDSIITLFSLNKAENNLCEIDESFNNEISNIKVYAPHECELCKSQSFLIPLYGDSFSIEPPKIELIELVSKHLPQYSKKILNSFSATGFFKVYKRLNDKDLEIFLDISSLFQNPKNSIHQKESLREFQDVWKKNLSRGLLGNLKRIVYTSSHYSHELAINAKKTIQKQLKDSVELVRAQDLAQQKSEEKSSSIVISACLDDAYELTGINLDLRNLQPKGNVVYLFPITRGKSKGSRDRVKSTLTHGNSGPNAYDLYTIQSIDIPECNAEHSWAKELKFLIKLVQWSDIQQLTIPETIIKRIDLLNNAPSTGLTNDLYWGNYNNHPLKIRRDYVYIDNAGDLSLSQADIYVSIAMVLHNLREGLDGPSQLICRPYHIGVISPENFIRFNDGIIHASLLRAARGFELNYAKCDVEVSRRIKNILLTMIVNYASNNSESLMEFLIAISIGSLTLLHEDIDEICTSVIAHSHLSEQFKIVCRYIQATTRA